MSGGRGRFCAVGVEEEQRKGGKKKSGKSVQAPRSAVQPHSLLDSGGGAQLTEKQEI